MTKPAVVVLDYGSGNIRSAQRALERAGAEVTVSSDPKVCASAAGLVVPGVGAFDHCVAAVKKLKADVMIERRLIAQQAVLGICVGMQMMFSQGVEGAVESDGLGQWDGVVTRLNATKLPHMGWNTVEAPGESKLFEKLNGANFYFVHSYAATALKTDLSNPIKPPIVSFTNYQGRFISAIENGPLSAVQFHPEKSGDAGIGLLQNWIGQL